MKLKGFTVIEIIVTMMLSTVIVLLTLQFYLNYQSLIIRKNNQMECGRATLQFYHLFKNEFDMASSIIHSGRNLTLINLNKRAVVYEFEQDFIVRNFNERLDTFFLKVNDWELIEDPDTGIGKILNMELVNCGETYPIYFVKQYSNDEMMNKLNFK